MKNNIVIGINNDMQWHLQKDLAHFKKVTSGHTVIMGRKTYESIGRPLPNRKNIILTRQQSLNVPEKVQLIRDLNVVKEGNEQNPREEYIMIGGGELYRQSIDFADGLYITKYHETFES